MEALARAYWEPVRRYLQLRWRESEEDAADLAQAFFSRSIEAETFLRYDPARGTFRTFLRTCLDRFVLNARRRPVLPSAPLEYDVAADDESAEMLFHKEWVRHLFRLAVDDLRAGSEEKRYRVFEAYDLSEAEARPTYQELGERFGLSAATVTNYLAAMRRDLRRTVLDRLRELTATEREYRSEARAILGIDV